MLAGTLHFGMTEYIPLYYPQSFLGRFRSWIEEIWTGVGGVGGWQLGSAEGGWGEGPLVLDTSRKKIS